MTVSTSTKGPSVSTAELREQYRKRYEELKEAGKTFYPYTVYKDAIVALVIFLVVLGLVAVLGVPLEGEADPLDTSYIPRPEWYFLFLFEFLKFFPGELEFIAAVVIPGIGLLLLFLLPFYDRNPSRKPGRRKLAIGVMLFVMAGISYLTVAAILAPVPRVPAVTIPAPGLSALEKVGLRAYEENGCSLCHQVNGVGGTTAPELSEVGKRLTAGWLVSHLEDPQRIPPDMPKFRFSNQDLMGLTAYLLSLTEAQPLPEGAPVFEPVSPEAVAGKQVFDSLCNACHPGGGTGLGPRLFGDDFNKRFANDDTLADVIRKGVGSMPGFGRERVNDRQLAEMIAYIRSLK